MHQHQASGKARTLSAITVAINVAKNKIAPAISLWWENQRGGYMIDICIN
jgi:hypothetical protein